jgi:hypothetical protein
MYLVHSMPFETKARNIIELLNELTILIASYLLIPFTDLVDDIHAKYLFGWLLIFLTIFNMLINFVIVTIQTINALRNNSNQVSLLEVYEQSEKW